VHCLENFWSVTSGRRNWNVQTGTLTLAKSMPTFPLNIRVDNLSCTRSERRMVFEVNGNIKKWKMFLVINFIFQINS
jgi:hypothetical protein